MWALKHHFHNFPIIFNASYAQRSLIYSITKRCFEHMVLTRLAQFSKREKRFPRVALTVKNGFSELFEWEIICSIAFNCLFGCL